jgi:hypothetical protein
LSANRKAFQNYIWVVQNKIDVSTLNVSDYLKLGAFGPVLIQQQEIGNGPEMRSAEDETVSNIALITLLQQLSALVPKSGIQLQCTPTRIRFNVSFKHGTKTAEYKTETDGAFRTEPKLANVGKKIIAIFEVKKRQRTKREKQIQMQEAAEIVGVIKNSRPLDILYFSNQLVPQCFP